MVGRLGYQADVAVDGVEALEAVEQKTYDVVLMDVRMPGWTAREATKRIRARSRGGPGMVAVTASVTEDERSRCEGAGMDGFLSKPYALAQLCDPLRSSAIEALGVA